MIEADEATESPHILEQIRLTEYDLMGKISLDTTDKETKFATQCNVFDEIIRFVNTQTFRGLRSAHFWAVINE